ncbi:MAG TPA: hypothetical protein PLN18_00180 [Candidatus Colwellbacteria bacterium]|nr:hypothetical protein [Candidatus Colwellbacteria bacterium]
MEIILLVIVALVVFASWIKLVSFGGPSVILNGVLPLTKSPHRRGRLGSRESQDWYASVRQISRVFDRLTCKRHRIPEKDIVLICDFQEASDQAEADLYAVAMEEFGIYNPRIIRDGLETIRQVDVAFDLAAFEGKRIIFFGTWFHYLRILWIIRRHPKSKEVPWELRGAFGIPRPKEAVTDIILTLVFPILDLFGLRSWFVELTNRRRAEGRH